MVKQCKQKLKIWNFGTERRLLNPIPPAFYLSVVTLLSCARQLGAAMAMQPMPMPPPGPGGDAPPAPMMMPGMAMPMTTGMSFTWGHRAVVLFPRWPGDRAGVGMYLLCLLLVLALAALAEALSAASRRLDLDLDLSRSRGRRRRRQLLAAGVHAARMGLAYLVMLAVMSFNAGVLLAAVAGHAAGFLLARSGRLGSRAAAPEIDAAAAAAATSNGSSLHPSSEPKP